MNNSVRDLRDTIIPKSDQLNADQLMSGPMTITVTDVRRSGDEQPVVVHYEGENGRPYKPCKSMRRILMHAWGADGSVWIGRSMTLFNRMDVKFGGQEVGGIRISHLSDIPADLRIAITSTRGKKEPTSIKRLIATDQFADSRARLKSAAQEGEESLKKAWASLPKDHKHAIGPQGCPDDLKRAAALVGTVGLPEREPDLILGQQPPQDADASAVTIAEITAKIASATNVDDLDAAYDMVSLIAGATPDDRKALSEAYQAQRDELDL